MPTWISEQGYSWRSEKLRIIGPKSFRISTTEFTVELIIL